MAQVRTQQEELSRQEHLQQAQQLSRQIKAGDSIRMGMAQSAMMNDMTSGEVLQRERQMDRMQRARRAYAEGQAAEGMQDSWRAKAAAAMHGMDLKMGMEAENLDEEEEEDFNRSATERIQSSQGKARIQAQKEQAKSASQKEFEKELKKKAKAGIQRGVVYVVDLVAGSIDASSMGVTFLIDMFFYFFTFGWLNVQLFYGTYLKKGKDPVIPPLTWDPIPPILPDTYLYGILIAIDILLIIAFVFAITISVIVIGFAWQIVYHPIDTLISNPGTIKWIPGILTP